MRCYQPVSFLGVLGVLIISIGLLDVVVLVVVVALPGPVSTGSLAGSQPPVVVVVISGAEVVVVVVAYCASVLPPGALVAGDVVVVLGVASPEEQIVTYTLCDTKPLLVVKTHC